MALPLTKAKNQKVFSIRYYLTHAVPAILVSIGLKYTITARTTLCIYLVGSLLLLILGPGMSMRTCSFSTSILPGAIHNIFAIHGLTAVSTNKRSRSVCCLHICSVCTSTSQRHHRYQSHHPKHLEQFLHRNLPPRNVLNLFAGYVSADIFIIQKKCDKVLTSDHIF